MIDRYSQPSTTTNVVVVVGGGGGGGGDKDFQMLDNNGSEEEEGEGEEDQLLGIKGSKVEGKGEDIQEDDQMLGNKDSLQDSGGHVMKALIVAFQVLVCMRVQGTPAIATEIPFLIIFSPLLLLQGAGAITSFPFCPKAQEFLEFILRGSRLLGWCSPNELEPQVLPEDPDNASRYSFFNTPSSVVEKMSKKDLMEEVWTLQVEYKGLIEAAKSSKLKRDLLQKKEVFCQICTNKKVEVLLLPCKHWNLCRSCCTGRRFCPICRCKIEREYILGRVYDKLHL